MPPHPSRSFGVGGIAHDGPVLCLAAERDLVVSGSTDGVLKVWKVESAPGSSAHRVVKGHAGPLWCVCFVDGKYIATGSADNTACFWEVDMAKQAKPYMVFRGHSGGVTAICSVPDVEQVVSLLRMAAPPASCLLYPASRRLPPAPSCPFLPSPPPPIHPALLQQMCSPFRVGGRRAAP